MQKTDHPKQADTATTTNKKMPVSPPQPKSILKKGPYSKPPPKPEPSTKPPPPPNPIVSLLPPSLQENDSIRSSNPQHLATALHHATLLQRRKDLELEILFSIESLLEVPEARQPTSQEIDLLKRSLRPFQPSDFDSLLEERQTAGRCAWALCPNPSPSLKSSRKRNSITGLLPSSDGGGGFKIVNAGKRDVRFVSKREAEMWCGAECARQAMYVKVQLSEVPAWERDAGYGGEIELLSEREGKTQQQRKEEELAERIEGLKIVEDPERRNGTSRQQGLVDLAFERGETKPAAVVRGGLVEVNVKEKEVSRPVMPPSLDDEESEDDDEDVVQRKMERMHISLEGYQPKFGGQQGRS
jgi:hypothetical protein